LSALFTAVAALAAWAAVSRAERESRRSSWPDAPRRSNVDKLANQTRLTVVNYGGPARYTEASTFWQPEFRTFHLHGPPEAMPEESAIFVEGRDMAKRHLFVTT